MKELGWLLGLTVVVMIGGFFVFPHEEIGDVNYAALNKCPVTVEAEPYSPSTYFKTFTCTNAYSAGLNCYYLETQSGICTKSIHYYKPLSTGTAVSGN